MMREASLVPRLRQLLRGWRRPGTPGWSVSAAGGKRSHQVSAPCFLGLHQPVRLCSQSLARSLPAERGQAKAFGAPQSCVGTAWPCPGCCGQGLALAAAYATVIRILYAVGDKLRHSCGGRDRRCKFSGTRLRLTNCRFHSESLASSERKSENSSSMGRSGQQPPYSATTDRY